jgi:KDO2-lipid IV(A) lauroyltransferase
VASTVAPAVHFAQYAALRSCFGLLHAFGVEENLRTAAGFGRLYASVVPRHRRRAMDNLAHAMPHLSEGERHDLAVRSLESMFQLFMVESVATPRLVTPTSWTSHVTFAPSHPLLQRALGLLLERRPVILCTGHCGNWELLGFVMTMLGFDMTALARPLDNPWLNRWILGVREARGLRILTKWGATEVVQDILDRRGRVGFIADQNAGDDGLFVPFFNRLASTYKSIPLLAMRHEVPIVVGAAHRSGDRFHYEFDVHDVIEPHEWAAADDPAFLIAARVNRGIELAIRRSPWQYLWMHRRWKSRPPHERQGKPMPDRLRAKLQSLPWMTDALLEQLALPLPPITR